MSLEELIDRLKYRLDGYFHSEKKPVKYLARLLAFTLFAAVVSTIAPTLADELSSSPEMIEPVAPVSGDSSTITIGDSATPTISASPTFSPEAQITRPAISNSSESPLPESSDSATADGPGVPLKIQPKYTLKIPATGAIDPRATKYFAPLIHVAVSDPDVEYTMACISGTGLTFDIKGKQVANNTVEGPDEYITGDQSGLLILSATTNRVTNLINSAGGLFISSTGGGLSGRSLTFRFIAVTKPVVDPEFCSVATSGVVTTLRPLGLDLSTIKGGGKLK